MRSPTEPEVERLLSVRTRLRRRSGCEGLEKVAWMLSGEATPAQLREAADHLEVCPECRETLAALQAAEREPRARPGVWAPGMLRWVLAGAFATLAALALGIVLRGWMEGGTGSSGERFVAKGLEDSIAIAVRRGDRDFTASPGDRLLEGDRLGFFYTSKRPGFLGLLDVDSEGTMGVLFPAGGQTSGPIGAGREVPLPDGGVLRSSERCEWVVGVFSNTPLGLEELKERIRQAIPSKEAKGPCRLRLAIPGARSVIVFAVR